MEIVPFHPQLMNEEQPRVSCCHKLAALLKTAGKICCAFFIGYELGHSIANQGRLNFMPDDLAWRPAPQVPLLTCTSTALVAQSPYSTAVAQFYLPPFDLPPAPKSHQFSYHLASEYYA